jgi:hypothetical protein
MNILLITERQFKKILNLLTEKAGISDIQRDFLKKIQNDIYKKLRKVSSNVGKSHEIEINLSQDDYDYFPESLMGIKIDLIIGDFEGYGSFKRDTHSGLEIIEIVIPQQYSLQDMYKQIMGILLHETSHLFYNKFIKDKGLERTDENFIKLLKEIRNDSNLPKSIRKGLYLIYFVSKNERVAFTPQMAYFKEDYDDWKDVLNYALTYNKVKEISNFDKEYDGDFVDLMDKFNKYDFSNSGVLKKLFNSKSKEDFFGILETYLKKNAIEMKKRIMKYSYINKQKETVNESKRPKSKGKICPEGIAWAKRNYEKWPSAYASMGASKYCKEKGKFKK